MPPTNPLIALVDDTNGVSGLTGHEVCLSWKNGKKGIVFCGGQLERSVLRALGGCFVAICVAAGSAFAADVSGRMKQFERQLGVLDGRASQQYAYSERLRERAAPLVPAYNGEYRGVLLKEARDAAQRHRVPEDLFLRLVNHESRWNVRAVSPKGARGLAQLMPETARALKVNPDDPSENLEGGARYLAAQYTRFRSWRLALAAYNAGPGAVEKYGDVPPFKETQDYVRTILGE